MKRCVNFYYKVSRNLILWRNYVSSTICFYEKKYFHRVNFRILVWKRNRDFGWQNDIYIWQRGFSVQILIFWINHYIRSFGTLSSNLKHPQSTNKTLSPCFQKVQASCRFSSSEEDFCPPRDKWRASLPLPKKHTRALEPTPLCGIIAHWRVLNYVTWSAGYRKKFHSQNPLLTS